MSLKCGLLSDRFSLGRPSIKLLWERTEPSNSALLWYLYRLLSPVVNPVPSWDSASTKMSLQFTFPPLSYAPPFPLIAGMMQAEYLENSVNQV